MRSVALGLPLCLLAAPALAATSGPATVQGEVVRRDYVEFCGDRTITIDLATGAVVKEGQGCAPYGIVHDAWRFTLPPDALVEVTQAAQQVVAKGVAADCGDPPGVLRLIPPAFMSGPQDLSVKIGARMASTSNQTPCLSDAAKSLLQLLARYVPVI